MALDEGDGGPDLGLPPGCCRDVADVDEAIMRLNARYYWLQATGRQVSGRVRLSMINGYLDRRLLLATAAMVKA